MISIMDVNDFNVDFSPIFFTVFCHIANFLLAKDYFLILYSSLHSAPDKPHHPKTQMNHHLSIPARTQTRETNLKKKHETDVKTRE